jgi:hypothetical protein
LIFGFDGIADVIGVRFGQCQKFGMRSALKCRVEQKNHPYGSNRREKQKWPNNTNPMTVMHGCFLYVTNPSPGNIYSVAIKSYSHY